MGRWRSLPHMLMHSPPLNAAHRRVLYLGAPLGVRIATDATIPDLMLDTGQNTGNLLIGDAIRRQLSPGTVCTANDLLQRSGAARALPRLAPLEMLDTTELERSFDVIVIGASNFLHGGADFGRWASFLESVQLPCVIIGLGAQAPDFNWPVEVPAGTGRMLRILAERSVSLGVRGDFTAETVRRLGIDNVRVVGCPSMYWTCQPDLRVVRRTATNEIAVSVNGSANVVDHSVDPRSSRRVEAAIARLSFELGYPYVLQNETELMAILTDVPGSSEASLVNALRQRYGFADTSSGDFISFVRRNMRVYSELNTWLAAVQQSDFVLGTRFHGCLVALLGGVPCFVIVHDARTREMCELLRIPHEDVRNVGAIDVRGLYDTLDIEGLETTYRLRFRNYVDFLDENSLSHCLVR